MKIVKQGPVLTLARFRFSPKMYLETNKQLALDRNPIWLPPVTVCENVITKMTEFTYLHPQHFFIWLLGCI